MVCVCTHVLLWVIGSLPMGISCRVTFLGCFTGRLPFVSALSLFSLSNQFPQRGNFQSLIWLPAFWDWSEGKGMGGPHFREQNSTWSPIFCMVPCPLNLKVSPAAFFRESAYGLLRLRVEGRQILWEWEGVYVLLVQTCNQYSVLSLTFTLEPPTPDSFQGSVTHISLLPGCPTVSIGFSFFWSAAMSVITCPYAFSFQNVSFLSFPLVLVGLYLFF